jgi:hypothetical protein
MKKYFKLFGSAFAALWLLGATAWSQPLVGKTEDVEVERTQLIASFARTHGLAAEHVAWANGLTPTQSVTDGQILTIPSRLLPSNPPRNGAFVNLAERGAYLFRGGEFVDFFPVSIGMGKKTDYHTPTGSFEIVSRIKNPEWRAPQSDWAEAMKKDRISADDKNNPLGEYWFGFNAPTGGYGFHENTAPDYTGDEVSHGCLRLYPSDAKRIYDEKLLQPGDKVRVVNQPVRLTRTADGDIWLAVFPGVYERQDLAAILQKELTEEHIGVFSGKRIKELAKSTDGVPRQILRRNVTLTHAGAEFPESGQALLVDGKVLMPAAALTHLDVQVSYDPGGFLKLSGNEQALELEVGGNRDDTAYRLGDSTFVQADKVLRKFDIPYEWLAETKTLNIGGDKK